MSETKPAAAFVIEKGIPIPPKIFRLSAWHRYPYGSMVKGDSFFVPDVKVANIHAALKKYREKKLGSYEARAAEKDGVLGVRIWCVEPLGNDPLSAERQHQREIEARRKELEQKKPAPVVVASGATFSGKPLEQPRPAPPPPQVRKPEQNRKAATR